MFGLKAPIKNILKLAEPRQNTHEASGIFFKNKTSELISSLILYELGPTRFGIGSISTPKALRTKSYASQLISEVIQGIEVESPEAEIFLYSDIAPEFYERFGFLRLPPTAQRYKTSTCMIRSKNVEAFFEPSSTPKYF